MANTNDMNTPTKVPCGGFVLGEGLALSEDGKTLNVSGGGTQADWNQNDETAADYVKNRPGGYEGRIEITWDGDTTGRAKATVENVPGAWYKVSDKILTADDIKGGTITVIQNGVSQSLVVPSDEILRSDYGVVVGENAVMISAKQGIFDIGGYNISIPESGTYFTSVSANGHSLSVSSFSNIAVHPFDDKYIPNTIARKAELDSRITEKEVILTSSTTDSTKKFKITVDDTGAIKATEVTNN